MHNAHCNGVMVWCDFPGRADCPLVRTVYEQWRRDIYYSSRTIVVDLRHRFTVIHMNEMNVFDARHSY